MIKMNVFDRIIGYSAEKKELEQISDILKNREIYENMGVQMPNGLLLYGEPGVGKTVMADSLSKACGLKTFVCRKNEPDGKFVESIKKVFEEAAEHAPAIVLLDDMDKFANEDSAHCNADEYVTIQSCIDEYKGRGLFVLATANDIDDLPDSLLRAGRFDRVMEIKPPRGKDAEKIIGYYLSKKKVAQDLDVELISRILDGRSCAELETIVNDAGIYAGFERAKEVSMNHLMTACLSRIYEVSAAELLATHEPVDVRGGYSDALSSIYHEAGHVVVAEVLYPGATTIASTFHKKGEKAGFTITSNFRSVDANTWKNYSMFIGLGGRAAVEQRFGIVDEGSAKDISEIFDLLSFQTEEQCIHGFDLYSSNYFMNSDDMKTRLAQTKATVIKRCYQKTKEILLANNKLLERVAEELAVHGVLDMNDIKKLTDECGIVSVGIG